MNPYPVPAHRDAASEACERAARSAAQAVDEVTKENLRRLEATMSWLQNEVRHLPRAPQIAPVRGVPTVRAQPPLPATSAFDAIIDRSSLARTVQGMTVQPSPPLPIWLCEHEAPIRLPPPQRDSGGLWRRLVKFFWACTVAAPIAYVFAITTSPLHKHLADIAGLTSAISSFLPTHDAQHAQLRGRDLIAIAPRAAPEPSAAAEGAPVHVASAPTGEPAPSDADHAERAGNGAGATEPAGHRDDRGCPIASDRGTCSGTPTRRATPAARQDVTALTEQGKAFFEIGDLVAARILFRRAAKAGDAAAADCDGRDL